jgi:hypothetical protein
MMLIIVLLVPWTGKHSEEEKIAVNSTTYKQNYILCKIDVTRKALMQSSKRRPSKKCSN